MLAMFFRIIFLIALCVVRQTPALAEPLEEVTFCRFPSMLSILPYVAEKQGFFEQAGLKVTFHEVVQGKICQDEVVAGRADFANVGNAPVAYLSASKHPLKIIAVVEKGRGVSVVARKDSGIKKFEDLKGKHVAFLPGTLSSIFVWKMLDKFGWPREALKLSVLQPPAMVQALGGNQIDAMVTWDPWIANARAQLGANAVYLSGADRYDYQGFLVMNEATLATRREAAKRMLRAYIKAHEFIVAHPEDAQKLIQPYVQMSAEVLKEAWPKFQTQVGFPPETVAKFNETFMLIKKFEPEFKDKPLPDLVQAFDPSLLNEVDPARLK